MPTTIITAFMLGFALGLLPPPWSLASMVIAIVCASAYYQKKAEVAIEEGDNIKLPAGDYDAEIIEIMNRGGYTTITARLDRREGP